MESLKILIADDHQMFRQGLESLLRKKLPHCIVKQASNGKEVLNLFDKESFNLVFMDIQMPEKNGIETTKELLKNHHDVKVISISMMDDRKSIVEMFRAGALGYVLKNASFDEIESAIECVMIGKKYYSKNISDILLDRTLESESEKKRKISSVKLTLRETEIIRLICQSFTSSQISDILNVSEKTIESHRSHIYLKLEINNVIDLVYYALDNNLITRE